MRRLTRNYSQMELVALSRWPVLLVALLAINRPICIWHKGNLSLLAAIGTNCFMHFSWASVEATTSFSIHGIHCTL